MQKHGNQNTWLVAIVAIVAIVALILFKGGPGQNVVGNAILGGISSTGQGTLASAGDGWQCDNIWITHQCPVGYICGEDGRCIGKVACEACKNLVGTGTMPQRCIDSGCANR